MIRFLSVFILIAVVWIASVDKTMAQTAPVLSESAPGIAPPPPDSQVPPIVISAAVQSEVNHTRRLVRETRDNTDNIKSKGDFGAQLWLVQGQQFFEDWRKPTTTPTIDPVTIVQRGQPISTVFIFYGTGRDSKGICNLHYDVVVKRPNGSIYDRRDDLVGWQNLAPTSDRQLMLGRDFVTINIGLDDPAGLYTVEATVRDNVSRQDLSLKQTFVVQ